MKVALRSRFTAVVLALVIAVPAWMIAAVAAPQLPDPGKVPISKQDQEKLGLKATGEVYQQMPVLPDSNPVTQYVQALGRKLDAVVPQQYNWPYQFHVVQESDINAFALPGGPIFVNLGTINAADNEAELAGVIAHEMSHVYMQHSIKGALQQQKYGALAGLLGAIGQAIGGVGGAIAQIGGQVGAGVISLRYSRGDEAQADAVGAIIMYKSGYDPRYMAQFFQKLEKEGGAGGPQFLSDHPNPGNRVAAVNKEIQNWPSRQYRNDTSQFAQVKQQARSVKAYTAQQIQQMAKSGQIHNTSVPAGVAQASGQGTMSNVNESQVMPSGSYQQLNQGGISIEYPSNWQAGSDQQGSTLTIAPPAGVSQGGIAYGALIGGFQPQNANSLDDAVSQLISTISQQNPGLKQAGSLQNIRVNGVAGKSVDLLGNSPLQGQNGQPQQEHDWLVALPDNSGNLVYLVFIAPERDSSKLRPTYEHMLKTFRLGQQ